MITPQQSRAATTSASVIGTPRVGATLALATPAHDAPLLSVGLLENILFQTVTGAGVAFPVEKEVTKFVGPGFAALLEEELQFAQAVLVEHPSNSRLRIARRCRSPRNGKAKRVGPIILDCAENPYSFRRPFGLAGFLRMR